MRQHLYAIEKCTVGFLSKALAIVESNVARLVQPSAKVLEIYGMSTKKKKLNKCKKNIVMKLFRLNKVMTRMEIATARNNHLLFCICNRVNRMKDVPVKHARGNYISPSQLLYVSYCHDFKE